MRHYFLFLVMVITFSAGVGAHAQAIRKKQRFTRIEVKEGLSNSNVTYITQDSRGFIWAGTDDGLNRYDGYEFKVYRSTPNDTATLLKNRIQHIFEDSRGTLWVSSLNAGLHYFDRDRDAFVQVKEFSFQHCQVMAITEDEDHTIWIGGQFRTHAFIAKLEGNVWKKFLLFPSKSPVSTILPDSSGEFWISVRDRGLYKWNLKTNASEHFVYDENDPAHSLADNYVNDVVRDNQGNLWIGTRNGLSKLETARNNITTYSAKITHGKNAMIVSTVRDLHLDSNTLWIATENGGVSKMNIDSEQFTNFTYNKDDPQSISDNSVWSVYTDREGRLWAGTFSKGLCVMDKLEEKFSEVDIPLQNDIVNAIRKDSKGRLWIGTEDGLVIQDKNTIRYFKHIPDDPKSLSSNPVLSLYEDNQHRMWIGTWAGGLNLFEESTSTFRKFMPTPRKKGSLSNPNVYAISQHSETGQLLVCTYSGLNVLVDEKEGLFESYYDDEFEGNNYLRTIYEDSHKNIWTGSIIELNKFDITTGTRKRYNVTPDSTAVTDFINCIYEDSHDRLWIGSTDGLHVMTADNVFTTFTKEDGLPVSIVQSILEDDKGNLWLGTTHGLSVFNPKTATFKNYDKSDGLLGNEFKAGACFKTEEGQMFFAGTGVNVFYPDSISSNPTPPPVYFTALKIFNQLVLPSPESDILKKDISETKEIVLDYKDAFFTLHYVALNFTSSHRNRYAYKLEGFDKEWNDVGSQRFATFTNLMPGTYTFRVRACNNDGVWNEEGASLIIRITPPWWRTFWFRLLSIAVLISSAFGLYFMSMSRVEKQNKTLETLVDVRTSELQKANQALAIREEEIVAQNKELMNQRAALESQNEELIQGQEEASAQRDMLSLQNHKLEEARRIIELKNEEIHLHNQNLEAEVEKRTQELVDYNHQLEQFAFISAHNLRAPVARILGLGEILNLPNQSREDEQSILDKLKFTTQELDRVVKDLNTILEIRKNNSSVITDINLTNEMQLIRANLDKEIQETQAIIREDFSAVNTVQSVKPYIDSVLMNLISNAIKYRHPDRQPAIAVISSVDGDYVCITVQDNGLGINLPKYEDKLFKLYNRFHSHVEGKGMGLYLVKTQVASLGGRIEVASEPNQGTTFRIFLKAKLMSILS